MVQPFKYGWKKVCLCGELILHTDVILDIPQLRGLNPPLLRRFPISHAASPVGYSQEPFGALMAEYAGVEPAFGAHALNTTHRLCEQVPTCLHNCFSGAFLPRITDLVEVWRFELLWPLRGRAAVTLIPPTHHALKVTNLIMHSEPRLSSELVRLIRPAKTIKPYYAKT